MTYLALILAGAISCALAAAATSKLIPFLRKKAG